MLPRRAPALSFGLVAFVSFLLVAPVVAAQSQQTWTGSATFSSGTRAGTNVSATGQLVLATQPGGWVKYAGNPVLSPSPGWSPMWTVAPGLLYEGGTYKMWYQGCSSANCSIGYATSTDGTTWTPYSGNPVLSPNSSSWDTSLGGPRVIHDGSVYRMWYSGNGPNGIRIGYATSSDGIHWTKFSPWPVFNGTMTWDTSAVNLPAVDKVGSSFIMYFSGSTGSSYSMGRATSPDGVNWTEYSGNPVLVATGGWEGDRVHPSWFSVGTGGYDLYYTGGTVGTPPQIGHATSLDGIHWTEDPANPVLTPDLTGTFDAYGVAHPFVLTVGTQVRMYFSGYSDGSFSVLSIGYATLNGAGGVSYVSQGTWVSPVFDSGDPNTTWSTISWVATTPTNTGVGASLYVGNTSTPGFGWTLSPPSITSPVTLHLPKARYAAVVVALVSLDSSQTPSLTSVSVSYERPGATPAEFGGLGLLGFLALLALAVGAGVAILALVLWSRRAKPAAPLSPSAGSASASGTFCPDCGAAVPVGNIFCGRCGRAVSPPGGPPP